MVCFVYMCSAHLRNLKIVLRNLRLRSNQSSLTRERDRRASPFRQFAILANRTFHVIGVKHMIRKHIPSSMNK